MNALVSLILVAASAVGTRPTPTAKGPLVTLDQALHRAATHNLDLKEARANLAASHELSKKAWAGYLPTVTVGGTYTRNGFQAEIGLPTGYQIRDVGKPQPTTNNAPGAPTSLILYPSAIQQLTIQRYNQLGAQAQLQQAIIAPPLWASIKSAYLGEKVAELNTKNARQQILYAVAQAYYGAVALKEAAQVQHQLVGLEKDRTHDAQVRYRAGAATKIAYLRAQIDLSKAQQDALRADDSYASAISSLAVLLDRAPDFEVTRPQEPSLPGAPEALEKSAVTQRPDVLAAEASVALAQSNEKAAWWRYFPSLGLTASYQISNVGGFTGQAGNWYVSLGLSWTLFDGGLREANIRQAKDQIAAASAALESAQAKAKDELRRALLELSSARANRVKAAEQVKLAKENLALVKANVKAGAGTYLDEEDATGQLIQSELSLVSNSLDAQLAVLKVAKAAGKFQPLS